MVSGGSLVRCSCLLQSITPAVYPDLAALSTGILYTCLATISSTVLAVVIQAHTLLGTYNNSRMGAYIHKVLVRTEMTYYYHDSTVLMNLLSMASQAYE